MENWTNNMKHFLIITNAFKDKNLKLTNEIKGYIEKKGGSCQCFTSTGDDAKHAAPEADAIAQETECVLVLGGDGTLIRAASKLVEQNMALIGVNLGTLGYLCELEESNVFAAVDELMEEHYTVEKRMMLCGYGIKQSEKTERKVAPDRGAVSGKSDRFCQWGISEYISCRWNHHLHADRVYRL